MVRRTVYGALLALAVAAPATAATTEPPAPERVDLGGTRVEVSSNPAEPVELEAGLWADTLTGPGGVAANAHWFRYSRTMRYSSVLVGAVATASEAGDSVKVEAFAPDGAPCGEDSSTSGGQAVSSAFGALVAVPDDELGDTVDPCVEAGHLDLRVSRGSSTAEDDLPIALRVVEEGPVDSSLEELPPVLEDPDVPVPVAVEPTALAGGTSFADAPDLTSGETVSAEVPEGAERLFRVRLGWGQTLAVGVAVPAQDDAAAAVLEFVSPSVNLTLIDPLRNTFDTGHPDAVGNDTYGDEARVLFDGTRPVNLANRFDDGEVSVPGDYWVSVSVAPPSDADRETVSVPVEVTAVVTDTFEDPPTFVGRVLSGDGNDDGPADYAPTTPYLVGRGTFSADVSGTPTVPGDEAAAGDGGRRVAGLAVGVASLLSLLAGVVLLRRRSRATAAA